MGFTALALTIALALQATTPAAPAARDAWPDDRPLTHLFQNLVADARALPSKASFELLLAGSAGAGVARGAFDHKVADWAGRSGPATYTKAGDKMGLGAVQGGAALATYAIGKIAHQPAAVHIGGDLIRAQVLTGVLTQGLKYGVGRTRPNGGKRSFPSGHASASFATAAVLGSHFGWKALPVYAAATFTAWTRVRDHVHYPSDVVFGATIGTIVGCTVTRGHRQRTWTIVPAKTVGGMALYVVKRGKE
jgi:membrane-associated phospholipid phosphatase